jgi:predicted DNA-binding transcriptional regulator YafY
MSYSKIYDLHSAILEFIRSNSKPRTQDILEYLEEIGDPISLRTVQRAIRDISYQTSATIVKLGLSPNHWYEIEEDADEQTPLLFSFLEHSRLADAFKSELNDEKSIGQIIYPDIPMTRGLDLIPKLIPAIKARKQVKFDYHKFNGDESSRKVSPYYLKQFRKRWYLIAKDSKDHSIKSFGLERMDKVEMTKTSFKLSKKEDPKAMFENVIGLFETERIPEKVLIWSEPYNANYIRTLPLHRSQKEIGERDNGFVFELTVVPNFEFYQEILRMSDRVKILGPESVREAMAATLDGIRRYYE